MKRARLSRALVTLCLVVFVLGGTFYAVRHRRETTALAKRIDLAKPTPEMSALVPAPTTQPIAAINTSITTSSTPTTLPGGLTNLAVVSQPQKVTAPVSNVVSNGSAPVITAAWTPTMTPLPPAPPTNFIAAASAQSTAGDLLGARTALNNALLSGKLNAFDTEATKKQIATLNDQLIFSTHKYADDEYGGIYVVHPGESLQKIAATFDVPWQCLAQINGLSDPRKMRSGQKLKVIKGPFNIVVTKSKFNMDLWLGGTPGQPGSMFVRSYPVGLGKEDSTPTGTWMVGTKAKDPIYYSPRGEGVMSADDPKNPLGHRWISIVGVSGKAQNAQSYGIHGTIEPDSIGKMASMGCIRMHNEDVAVVFDMLSEGKSGVLVQD